MGELFYVHYVPRQMLVQGLKLSPQAELAHRRLSDWTWSEGEMPPDHVPTLATIARCTPEEWPEIQKELQRAGWRVTPKGHCHAVARAVLNRARGANLRASRAGRLGAEARWRGKGPSTLAKTDADAPCASYAPAMATALAPPMPRQCHKRLTIKSTNNEKDLQRLTAELSGLSSSAPLQENGEENRFLNELARTLSEFDNTQSSRELTNWGGWWRLRYRENSDKAWRVLAEVRSMIREKRVLRNAGAAAKDLWERFQ